MKDKKMKFEEVSAKFSSRTLQNESLYCSTTNLYAPLQSRALFAATFIKKNPLLEEQDAYADVC